MLGNRQRGTELLPNPFSPGCIVQRTGLGCSTLGTEVENWKIGLCSLICPGLRSWSQLCLYCHPAEHPGKGHPLPVTIGTSLIKWSQPLPLRACLARNDRLKVFKPQWIKAAPSPSCHCITMGCGDHFGHAVIFHRSDGTILKIQFLLHQSLSILF